MGCCWAQRTDKSPTKQGQEEPGSNSKEADQRQPGRCWVLRKICAIFCYILRRCFCRAKSSAKVQPEAHIRNVGDSPSVSGTNEGVANEISSVNFQVPENDDFYIGDSVRQKKIQAHRPRTPRQPEKQGLRSWSSRKCLDDVMIEVDGIGDSDTVNVLPLEDTGRELNKPSGDDDHLSRATFGDITQTGEPVSLVINSGLISTTDVRALMDQNASFSSLTIEFDLRCHRRQRAESDEDVGEEEVTSDSIFEILQAAFVHPNVAELRVRIDNWRHYVHGLENILPDGPIGSQIRTDYPMKLHTLIIYCPGVTLSHLLIWQGFILSQVQLETLICNFDSVQWTFYKPIIRKLGPSLRKLELYSITNHNGNIDDVLPFDWSIMSNCQHLTKLKIRSDMRYYGLRTVGLEDWSLARLNEIELKYVDLGMDDIKHLLESSRLRRVTLQYFTPIPIPVTCLPTKEFMTTVTLALSQERLHFLSFTDYKLPGTIEERKNYLVHKSRAINYSSTWTTGLDSSYEVMAFQQCKKSSVQQCKKTSFR